MTASVTFFPWECSWLVKVLNGSLYTLPPSPFPWTVPCFSSGEPEVYGSVLNLSQPSILSCLAPDRGRLRLCLMCIHCTLDVFWQCQYPSQPGALGSSYSAPLHFEWDWPGLTSCWIRAGRHPVWKRTPHGSLFLLLCCVVSHQVGELGRPSAGRSLKELDWPEKIPPEINGVAVPGFLNWSRINHTPWENKKQQWQSSQWCNHKLWNIQVLGWLMAIDS